MSLPKEKKQHKITHLCCSGNSRFKAIGGRHLYQCSSCGQTDRGTDRERLHVDWRAKHVKECFTSEPVAMEISGTQAEFLVACKKGEVLGVKHDQFGPKTARFTWKAKF